MKPCASPPPSPADFKRGFSLLEAMVALAIASLILSAIAVLGAQVLRNWMRGQDTIAALEMLQRGLGRLETDLSLALPMPPPGSEANQVLFRGDAQSLLFPAATGFGAGNRGLELLSLTISQDGKETALVRRRGPIANLGTVMGDPVALLHGRMTVSFSYRDGAGQVAPTWQDQSRLPAAVLVDIRGASGAPLFPAPMVMPLMTNLSVDCLKSASGGGDDDAQDSGDGRCSASDTSSQDQSSGNGNTDQTDGDSDADQ